MIRWSILALTVQVCAGYLVNNNRHADLDREVPSYLYGNPNVPQPLTSYQKDEIYTPNTQRSSRNGKLDFENSPGVFDYARGGDSLPDTQQEYVDMRNGGNYKINSQRNDNDDHTMLDRNTIVSRMLPSRLNMENQYKVQLDNAKLNPYGFPYSSQSAASPGDYYLPDRSRQTVIGRINDASSENNLRVTTNNGLGNHHNKTMDHTAKNNQNTNSGTRKLHTKSSKSRDRQHKFKGHIANPSILKDRPVHRRTRVRSQRNTKQHQKKTKNMKQLIRHVSKLTPAKLQGKPLRIYNHMLRKLKLYHARYVDVIHKAHKKITQHVKSNNREKRLWKKIAKRLYQKLKKTRISTSNVDKRNGEFNDRMKRKAELVDLTKGNSPAAKPLNNSRSLTKTSPVKTKETISKREADNTNSEKKKVADAAAKAKNDTANAAKKKDADGEKKKGKHDGDGEDDEDGDSEDKKADGHKKDKNHKKASEHEALNAEVTALDKMQKDAHNIKDMFWNDKINLRSVGKEDQIDKLIAEKRNLLDTMMTESNPIHNLANLLLANPYLASMTPVSPAALERVARVMTGLGKLRLLDSDLLRVHQATQRVMPVLEFLAHHGLPADNSINPQAFMNYLPFMMQQYGAG